MCSKNMTLAEIVVLASYFFVLIGLAMGGGYRYRGNGANPICTNFEIANTQDVRTHAFLVRLAFRLN
jgi:hypothetical protein